MENHKDKINYQVADIFKWKSEKQYDTIFFSFWLSHVPPEHFDQFWESVMNALKPNGRVFFIDSISSSNPKRIADGKQNEFMQKRWLNDGREFEIVKIYYSPDDLKSKLSYIGINAEIKQTNRFFIYGSLRNPSE